MNLRLGRFGRQESACAVGLAALISGIFSVNVSDTFAQGNVCYMATAAGALLALLLLRLVDGAMVRQEAPAQSDLLAGGLKALALPLFRFTLVMERYIFVEADYVPIVLYLLPVLLLLVLRGMECVGRMAKLLLLPGALAWLLTLLLASPAFALYHLFPLFSPCFSTFLDQTGSALLRFLAPGLSLLVAGRGCQGQGNARKSVDLGLLLGGAGAFSLHLGLGLTFFGPDMASLSAPVYCMTMAARQERLGLRLDMRVLFLWGATGLVGAAFFLSAAALLLCRTMAVEDLRPVGALLVLLCMGLVLLFNFDSDEVLFAVRLVYRWGYLLLLVPLGLLWGRSLFLRRRV